MLGRRELSEAQIRQRLARRGHDPEAIDAAVARLLEERAIDDARVAGAIARTETGIRKRGRLRVRRKIESAGISPATARRAVDEVFGASTTRTCSSRRSPSASAAGRPSPTSASSTASTAISSARASNRIACWPGSRN